MAYPGLIDFGVNFFIAFRKDIMAYATLIDLGVNLAKWSGILSKYRQ